jgi:hypothetical protein
MPVLAPTLTKLEVIFTNRPAERPDGKNLWIDIDVNLTKLTALFHCQPPEHVGVHSPRKVTYRVDHDCVLRFTDRAVFNSDCVQMIAYKEKVLPVTDVNNVQTNYEMWSGTGNVTEVTTTLSQPRTNPHIVVP